LTGFETADPDGPRAHPGGAVFDTVSDVSAAIASGCGVAAQFVVGLARSRPAARVAMGTRLLDVLFALMRAPVTAAGKVCR
jgi:hypothetical protein